MKPEDGPSLGSRMDISTNPYPYPVDAATDVNLNAPDNGLYAANTKIKCIKKAVSSLLLTITKIYLIISLGRRLGRKTFKNFSKD